MGSHIKDTSSTDTIANGIEENFNSLLDTMYTLTACITGGIPWANAAKPIWEFGWPYGATFIGFVLLNILGTLNVIKGIFVERAANMKRHDRDFAISEELHLMEDEIQETMAMFQAMDEQGSGQISVEELERYLQQDRVLAHFAAIGIDVTDRSYISAILSERDKGGDGGSINIKEFVTGCIALRGVAKQ